MTRAQAQQQILSVKAYTVSNWDESEAEYCRKWFGKNFIPGGHILCAYCLEEPVEFKGYLGVHVCPQCQDSLDILNGKLPDNTHVNRNENL